MKKLTILTLGAAAMAFAAPAAADPGKGKGHGKHAKHGYGAYGMWGNSCPPGLAKKNNGCLPPGIAKKRWDRGDRWQSSYGTRWSYNQVPWDYRDRYNLDPYDRYYYRDGYIYQVDPKTMLVQQVLSAILR